MSDIFSLLSKNKKSGVTTPRPKTMSKPQESTTLPEYNPDFSKRWFTVGTHLIANIGHIPKTQSVRVAAFDMDHTLIKSKSGLKFGRGPHDWTWLDDRIPDALATLEEDYVVVIFTNQATVIIGSDSKSYNNLKTKVNKVVPILSRKTNRDIHLFAAAGRPGAKRRFGKVVSSEALHLKTRKPNPGMWEHFERHFPKIDKEQSFFVGDSAGRPGDPSDADLGFARAVGLRFLTPEEFLKERGLDVSKEEKGNVPTYTEENETGELGT